MQGICNGHSTNNIVDYSMVVELLFDAISHGIHHIVIRLDSQLVVLQLTNIYSVRNHVILRMVLRVHLPKRDFNFIRYEHIYRNINTLTNSLANFFLDQHLQRM